MLTYEQLDDLIYSTAKAAVQSHVTQEFADSMKITKNVSPFTNGFVYQITALVAQNKMWTDEYVTETKLSLKDRIKILFGKPVATFVTSYTYHNCPHLPTTDKMQHVAWINPKKFTQ